MKYRNLTLTALAGLLSTGLLSCNPNQPSAPAGSAQDAAITQSAPSPAAVDPNTTVGAGNTNMDGSAGAPTATASPGRNNINGDSSRTTTIDTGATPPPAAPEKK